MSTSLMIHTERAERKRFSKITDELASLIGAARAEHERLKAQALEALECDYGISRDRVNERGELEVTPEEFARLQSTSVRLPDIEVSSPLRATDFQIKVIVVQPKCEVVQ